MPEATKRYVSEQERAMIDRLLLERISLGGGGGGGGGWGGGGGGICRVMHVSQTWLLDCVAKLYEQLPDDLNAAPSPPHIEAYLEDNF